MIPFKNDRIENNEGNAITWLLESVSIVQVAAGLSAEKQELIGHEHKLCMLTYTFQHSK